MYFIGWNLRQRQARVRQVCGPTAHSRAKDDCAMTMFGVRATVLLLATVNLLCCFGYGSGTEQVRIGKPRHRQAPKFRIHDLGRKKHDQAVSQKLKGQLKLSIKDFFPDDEFSIKVPHLKSNGTCFELPPDVLEDQHSLSFTVAPFRKKHQRYCKHEDFGTCGHACCGVQVVAPKNCDTMCAYRRLLRSLRAKGPDQRFKLLNASDLRELEGAYRHNVEFMVDAKHYTEVYHKHQLIQLVISPVTTMGNQAIVKGFSLSVGTDSLRDFGQNYKNLAEILNSIFFDADRIAVLHGCGRNGLIQSQGTASVAVGTGIIGMVIGIIVTGAALLCFARQGSGTHKVN